MLWQHLYHQSSEIHSEILIYCKAPNIYYWISSILFHFLGWVIEFHAKPEGMARISNMIVAQFPGSQVLNEKVCKEKTKHLFIQVVITGATLSSIHK